jgi:hypothetical protein
MGENTWDSRPRLSSRAKLGRSTQIVRCRLELDMDNLHWATAHPMIC